MIRRHALAFLAVLAIGALAVPAEAGGTGGGSKSKNGTIRVLGGHTGTGVGVYLLPQGQTLPTFTSDADFLAKGGVVVNPSQVVQFKVGGPGTAYVFAPGTPAPSGNAAYSGAQNQTGYLKTTGASTAPAIEGSAGKW